VVGLYLRRRKTMPLSLEGCLALVIITIIFIFIIAASIVSPSFTQSTCI
jgi:hypothetical protein